MLPLVQLLAGDLLVGMVSTASVDSVPVPMRRITLPVRGSMRLTVPVRISCCLLLNSS